MRPPVIFFLGFFIRCLFAQALTPQLIGSSGGSASVGSGDIEWSVGETVVGPIDSSNITFGFQEYEGQPPVAVGWKAAPAFSVRQLPGLLSIALDPGSVYSVRLYNAKGRTLSALTTVPGQKELDVSTQKFSGMVLMNISTQNRQLLLGYKFMGGE